MILRLKKNQTIRFDPQREREEKNETKRRREINNTINTFRPVYMPGPTLNAPEESRTELLLYFYDLSWYL
jgi:hypothetical protein